MRILPYNEKPKNESRYYNHFSVNPNDPKSDVVWVTSREFLSRKRIDEIKDINFRDAISAMLPIWAAEARSHSNDTSWWPVKLAAIEFWLPEGKFTLYPADLGDGSECVDG